MKIAGRTLIILLAAAVVTAATMGAMQLPAVQSLVASGGGEHHGPPVGLVEGEQFPALGGERGERSGGDLQGLLEVGKNLGVVVLVSLAIVAIGWLARRLAPKRPAPAAAV